MSRLRCLWRRGLAAGLCVLVYFAWPGRASYTVSPETTRITGPFDEHGCVDYATALNQRLSAGIKQEENAQVLIGEALGPRPFEKDTPDSYFEWLGSSRPVGDDNRFIEWHTYNLARFPPDRRSSGLDDDDEWSCRRESFQKTHRDCGKRPWNRRDEPELSTWIDLNARPLALTREASLRPRLYSPLVPKSTDPSRGRLDFGSTSYLPTAYQCRYLAQTLTLRAMRHAGECDDEAAWADLQTCQRLGRLLASGASIRDGDLGGSIVADADAAVTTLLSVKTRSPDQIRRWRSERASHPLLPSLAGSVDSTHRFMALDLLMTVTRQGTAYLILCSPCYPADKWEQPLFSRAFSVGIDYDPAFRHVNQAYDRIVAALRLPDLAARQAALEELSAEYPWHPEDAWEHHAKVFKTRSTRGEAIGRLYVGQFVGDFDRYADRRDRSLQTQRNTDIAFALELHRADQGRYPATLAALVPHHLPAVPNDLFTGGPLRYEPTEKGYRLISVGPDVDDERDDVKVIVPVPD